MKINKKILLILTIFIGILLLLNIDCFALENVIMERFNGSFSYANYTSLSSAEEKLEVIKSFPIYSEESNNLKYLFLCNSNDPNGIVYLALSDYPFKVGQLNSGAAASTVSGIGTIHFYTIWFDKGNTFVTYSTQAYNYSEYTVFMSNELSSADMLATLSINHDLAFVDNDNIAISREDTSLPFPPITPTMEEVLAEGTQKAVEVTTQEITATMVELVPVGVVILATMILVYLLAYWNFWKK